MASSLGESIRNVDVNLFTGNTVNYGGGLAVDPFSRLGGYWLCFIVQNNANINDNNFELSLNGYSVIGGNFANYRRFSLKLGLLGSASRRPSAYVATDQIFSMKLANEQWNFGTKVSEFGQLYYNNAITDGAISGSQRKTWLVLAHFFPGASGQKYVDVYLNPKIGYPLVPYVSVDVSTVANIGTFFFSDLRLNTAINGANNIDEIRIGKTLASVLPAAFEVVDGDLIVTGSTSITKNFSVQGNAQLLNGLTVTGNSLFTQGITSMQDLEVNGSLTINDVANFNNSINVSGPAFIDGNLSVTGDFALGGNQIMHGYNPLIYLGTKNISSNSVWNKFGNTLYYGGENVGIGTSYALHRLDVQGNTGVRGTLFSRGVQISGEGSQLEFVHGFKNRDGSYGDKISYSRNRFYFSNSEYTSKDNIPPDVQIDGNLEVYGYLKVNGIQNENGVELSTQWVNNGNNIYYTTGSVGIGTSTVDTKAALHVVGNTKVTGILAASHVVINTTASIPDYVFEKGYKLQSLQDLEKFVKTHHHLPNIPSGKQIKENGLNMEEINLGLLKQVEELTLHLIELKKEVEILKAKK
jgi:predicted acyltransferase (DUF342 family)